MITRLADRTQLVVAGGTMKKWKCQGGRGCDKDESDRCGINTDGKPPIKTEKLYMCPYNHWRTCAWQEVTNNEGS